MTTTMASLLVANGVTVTYGGQRAVLQEVSAIAEPGRLLAVTGPPGAGKTTLLRALAGLIRPIGGAVTVEGAPLRDRDHAVARRIVLIPQDNGLASILTAAENITLALLADEATPADARRGTMEALVRLGLDAQADQLVEELSAGQQQRTAIARGLALRGDVLLADEITSELDARNQAARAGSPAGRGRTRRRGHLRHAGRRRGGRLRRRTASDRRAGRDGTPLSDVCELFSSCSL